MKRVVVTGIGIVSPLGIGAKTHFDRLLAGDVAIGRIKAFDPGGFTCQLGGEVPAYKINDFVPKSYRKATKVMARDIELAVIAADEAFINAGLKSKAYADPAEINGLRFGCNIGAGLISADLTELAQAMAPARGPGDTLDLKKWGTEGMAQLTPLWLLKYLPNMLACHVTIIHGLMGPSNTICCDAASSHLAIGEAFRTIQRGKADYAICGGAESRVNPMGVMRQQLLGRLNTTANDDPAHAVRPFAKDAAGTVFGEGGGLFILEDYDHATARGATIYAEVVGFAASMDAYAVTEPDPTGHSYAKAVENALREAKLTSADVDLLVPHASSYAPADAAELNGIAKGFGESASKIPVALLKAQYGSLAAGCGVDAATAVLSMRAGVIPPAVNSGPQIDGPKLNVSPTAREAKIDVAVSTVCSLGGQNAALVFKRV